MYTDTARDKHIRAILNGQETINDVPSELQAEVSNRVERGRQVRAMRHAGHEEYTNSDGTVTVVNNRLRVTLPQSEYRGRYNTFTRAMRMLGNKSELRLLESESVSDEELERVATECARDEYLIENTHYRPAEVMMRLYGGHIMSEGMRADVRAATTHAMRELRDNRDSLLSQARTSLQFHRDNEICYRQHYANDCRGWKIEIIAPMPEQIGMCRYQEAI